MSRKQRAEPNFARLVINDDLDTLEITAHALRRFVERLQPGIPGAARVVQAMGRLEEMPAGTRSHQEQNRLREHRDWLRAHVEPCIRDLLLCEGFLATTRPRWSRSRTPSEVHLQIGGLCYWPAAQDPAGHRVTLTTCLTRAETTWEAALQHGYTLIPKPHLDRQTAQLRTPGWRELLGRAWRSRHQHSGLLRALRSERTTAIEHTQREHEQATADLQATRDAHHAQWEHAQRTFRERHR